MSFTPRNVSQLLVADTTKTLATLVDVADFAITTVAASPVPNIGSDGKINESLQIMVKTSGGYKVSEKVVVANITDVNSGVLVAGTFKNVTVAYQAPADFIDKTFTCTIDVHDNIGSMLNDRFLSAYVVTDGAGKFIQADGTIVTATAITIGAEIAAILQSTVTQSRDGFTVTADGAGVITITETKADHVVGVKDGINLPWVVLAGMKEGDVSNQSLTQVPAVQVITEGKIDDLVQMKNIEWFNSGYDKDPSRATGYPVSFAVDSNLTAAGIAIGDAYCVVQFYKDRDATNVERQHRQIIIVGAGAATFAAGLIEIAATV